MNEQHMEYQEKVLRAPNGLGILLLNIVLMLAAVAGIVFSAMQLSANGSSGGMVALLVGWIVCRLDTSAAADEGGCVAAGVR